MKLDSDTNYATTLNPEDDYTMEHALKTNIAPWHPVNIALLCKHFKSCIPFLSKNIAISFTGVFQ